MNPAPGWYPDPSGPYGQLRYFDGTQWTEHRAAAPYPVAPMPAGYGTPTSAKRTDDGRELATWGIRFGAYVIDSLIIGIVSFAAMYPAQIDLQQRLNANEANFQTQVDVGGQPGLSVLLHGLGHDVLIVVLGQLAIQLIYATLFLRLRGATPGKLMLRLRVEPKAAPGQLSWSSALKRTVVQFVPIPLTAGVFALADGLWPLGDLRRQALHEKWARTQVIRLR
ncbi:MAG: hypothetical protein NVSMB48_15030 [Marmoricola sp.]